jgi:hypothetical protein
VEADAAQAPVGPKVKIVTIGMRVAGGPYDEQTKVPFKKAVEPRFPEVARCWAKHVPHPPKQADVGVDLLIEASGGRPKVSNPRSTLGKSPDVEAFMPCVIAVFESVEFPKLDRGRAGVSYSLRLTAKGSPRARDLSRSSRAIASAWRSRARADPARRFPTLAISERSRGATCGLASIFQELLRHEGCLRGRPMHDQDDVRFRSFTRDLARRIRRPRAYPRPPARADVLEQLCGGTVVVPMPPSTVSLPPLPDDDSSTRAVDHH